MHQLNPDVKEVFSGPHKIRKTAYRREAIEPSASYPGATGIRSFENGVYLADVFVTVDLEAIARSLGHKAMGNKSHISKYLGGFVTVEARNIQHEGGTHPQLRPEVKP